MNKQRKPLELAFQFTNGIAGIFLEEKSYILVLRLTALLLIIFYPYLSNEKLIQIFLPIFISLILVVPKLTTNRIIWIMIFILVAWNNINFWYQLNNHEYLITYWCLACTVAVNFKKDIGKVLARNAKILIGLCFLFATIWKILPGEYLDGSFFEATLLLDQRLREEAMLFGGLSSRILYSNQDLLTSLQLPQGSMEATLVSSHSLNLWAKILSYWTILIEGLVAIAFIFPKPLFLSQNRDWLLIIFIVTTYSAAPVAGFAAILTVMGYAQCPRNQLITSISYLLLYIFIPLWLKIPNKLFYLLSNLNLAGWS